MSNIKLERVSTPVEKSSAPLTELLRSGAKALISEAVELELEAMLGNYRDFKLTNGRQVVVRKGGMWHISRLTPKRNYIS